MLCLVFACLSSLRLSGALVPVRLSNISMFLKSSVSVSLPSALRTLSGNLYGLAVETKILLFPFEGVFSSYNFV